MEKPAIFFRVTTFLVLMSFLLQTLLPSPSFAQTLSVLPAPTQLIALTPKFSPPHLRGLKFYPDNPLRFDFIIDEGDNKLTNPELKAQSSQFIKYFLASLTIPEQDLWVNLSPAEKDRVIPQELGLTEMGVELLAQDYILKQLVGSLTYPESPQGRRFWDRVYQKASQLFGTSKIPINTFNKVWIVPDKAEVFEDKDRAILGETHLKVMLEEDYLLLKENLKDPYAKKFKLKEEDVKEINNFSSQIMKEVILPELEREVNEGRNFQDLRQIYHALILATWFKQKLKSSILNQVYINQKKLKGIDIDDPESKEKIYNLYLKAYSGGLYNYIRKDTDPLSKKSIRRRYISGGFDGTAIAGIVGRGSSLLTDITQEQLIHFDSTPQTPLHIITADLINVSSEEASAGSPAVAEETAYSAVRERNYPTIHEGLLTKINSFTNPNDFEQYIAEMARLDTKGVIQALLLVVGAKSTQPELEKSLPSWARGRAQKVLYNLLKAHPEFQKTAQEIADRLYKNMPPEISQKFLSNPYHIYLHAESLQRSRVMSLEEIRLVSEFGVMSNIRGYTIMAGPTVRDDQKDFLRYGEPGQDRHGATLIFNVPAYRDEEGSLSYEGDEYLTVEYLVALSLRHRDRYQLAQNSSQLVQLSAEYVDVEATRKANQELQKEGIITDEAGNAVLPYLDIIEKRWVMPTKELYKRATQVSSPLERGSATVIYFRHVEPGSVEKYVLPQLEEKLRESKEKGRKLIVLLESGSFYPEDKELEDLEKFARKIKVKDVFTLLMDSQYRAQLKKYFEDNILKPTKNFSKHLYEAYKRGAFPHPDIRPPHYRPIDIFLAQNKIETWHEEPIFEGWLSNLLVYLEGISVNQAYAKRNLSSVIATVRKQIEYGVYSIKARDAQILNQLKILAIPGVIVAVIRGASHPMIITEELEYDLEISQESALLLLAPANQISTRRIRGKHISQDEEEKIILQGVPYAHLFRILKEINSALTDIEIISFSTTVVKRWSREDLENLFYLRNDTEIKDFILNWISHYGTESEKNFIASSPTVKPNDEKLPDVTDKSSHLFESSQTIGVFGYGLGKATFDRGIGLFGNREEIRNDMEKMRQIISNEVDKLLAKGLAQWKVVSDASILVPSDIVRYTWKNGEKIMVRYNHSNPQESFNITTGETKTVGAFHYYTSLEPGRASSYSAFTSDDIKDGRIEVLASFDRNASLTGVKFMNKEEVYRLIKEGKAGWVPLEDISKLRRGDIILEASAEGERLYRFEETMQSVLKRRYGYDTSRSDELYVFDMNLDIQHIIKFDENKNFQYLVRNVTPNTSLLSGEKIEPSAGSPLTPDQSTSSAVTEVTKEEGGPEYGGIDLNPASLSMKSRKDSTSSPLIFNNLPFDLTNFQGFTFQIIKIEPVKDFASLIRG